jgi:hypothetical protein
VSRGWLARHAGNPLLSIQTLCRGGEMLLAGDNIHMIEVESANHFAVIGHVQITSQRLILDAHSIVLPFNFQNYLIRRST